MQTREKILDKDRILDDVARFAGGAVSALGGIRRQVKDEVRARVDEFAQKLDLVPREDFERLELMLYKAREEQTRLHERLEALEGKLGKAKKQKPSLRGGRRPTK